MFWDDGISTELKPTVRTGRVLPTRGDPLGALRHFLSEWWLAVDLQAMVAPIESPGCNAVFPQMLTSPEQLAAGNPFAPIMGVNTAGLIEEFISAFPEGRLAVLLRPCELRTYVELRKRRLAFRTKAGKDPDTDRLALISIDCPGVLDSGDFIVRAEAEGLDSLTLNAIEWIAHGRWTNGHLRLACQQCEWPIPCGADLTLGILGTNTQENLQLIAADEATAAQLCLEQLTEEPIDEADWQQRSSASSLLLDWHSSQPAPEQQRLVYDSHSLLAAFARCNICTDCLDACPLYDGELAGMLGVSGTSASGAPLLVNLVAVSRWLASCSGCGMCQEACEQNIPLLNIIYSFNRRLRSELNYQPGNPQQPLPWTG